MLVAVLEEKGALDLCKVAHIDWRSLASTLFVGIGDGVMGNGASYMVPEVVKPQEGALVT